MNLTASRLIPREAKDPKHADYWLILEHISGVLWEVPVTKAELEKLQPWLPKELRTLAKAEGKENDGN